MICGMIASLVLPATLTSSVLGAVSITKTTTITAGETHAKALSNHGNLELAVHFGNAPSPRINGIDFSPFTPNANGQSVGSNIILTTVASANPVLPNAWRNLHWGGVWTKNDVWQPLFTSLIDSGHNPRPIGDAIHFKVSGFQKENTYLIQLLLGDNRLTNTTLSLKVGDELKKLIVGGRDKKNGVIVQIKVSNESEIQFTLSNNSGIQGTNPPHLSGVVVHSKP